MGEGGPVVVGRLHAKLLDPGRVSHPLTLRFLVCSTGRVNDPFLRANSISVCGCLVLSILSSE